MIKGYVNPRSEAIITLKLRGPSGIELDFEAVIDTGFTSSLALSASAVATLGLTYQSGGMATLGDGSVSRFDIYAAELLWMGAWRPIFAYELGNETLIGLELLETNSLRIDVTPGGLVEIVPLP